MLSPEEFLGMSVEGSMSTKIIPIPEGTEFLGLIDDIGLADFTFKQGERAGQKGYRMTVKWELQDDDKAIEEKIGRKPVITQSLMLDITPEGGLDMGEGKNVRLGQLREAVGQNKDGQPWQPIMLKGQIAKLAIKHKILEGDIVAEVSGVTSAQ